ncbi:MAG: hypothetical protein ABI627_26800 [Polyangiaceae bacterium]
MRSLNAKVLRRVSNLLTTPELVLSDCKKGLSARGERLLQTDDSGTVFVKGSTRRKAESGGLRSKDRNERGVDPMTPFCQPLFRGSGINAGPRAELPQESVELKSGRYITFKTRQCLTD